MVDAYETGWPTKKKDGGKDLSLAREKVCVCVCERERESRREVAAGQSESGECKAAAVFLLPQGDTLPGELNNTCVRACISLEIVRERHHLW